jgi:translation initiation factor 1 (eIF-1/SUI1)
MVYSIRILLISDIKLKDAAKKFGKKFACGASVVDDNSIELQGDVPHDLMEYLQQEYSQVGKINLILIKIDNRREYCNQGEKISFRN